MMTNHLKHPPYKIIILTCSIGAGHVSVARAIAEALGKKCNGEFEVKIVDFITAFENFATAATKKIYLNSLKISPKLYEFLFLNSSKKIWPVKLLNMLSEPFMKDAFKKMLVDQKPALIVSTYPIWDMLLKKTLEENGGEIPFVSVITDSISIHGIWTTGNPDFFIVANKDTAQSLKSHGISDKKIKIFGYPISQNFADPMPKNKFLKELGLSPGKITVLAIFSLGLNWSKVQKTIDAIQNSKRKNFQLIVISASGNKKWQKKLSDIKWKMPVFVTGWTDEMQNYINCANIVITKAGGSTVMECINCKKPMIIIEALPGHEAGNAMLVEKYNLGTVVHDNIFNFDDDLEYLLKNEALIKKNLARLARPRAAQDCARFLANLAENKKAF